MYNIQFSVKYNDIETELLEKLKNKHEMDVANTNTDTNTDTNANTNYDEEVEEYTSQDVIDICEKLYKDELLSVFNADNITDDIILLTIKDIFKIMLTNSEFHTTLNEIKSQIIHDTSSNKYSNKDVSLNTDEFIFFTMFSHQTFHITHKCICQMLSSETIEDILLSQFKHCGIKMFNTNM